jgi:hypothetical protein
MSLTKILKKGQNELMFLDVHEGNINYEVLETSHP